MKKNSQRKDLSGCGRTGIAGSYSRYSSEHQREEGIADQQRRCREWAQQHGQAIDPRFEFVDEAVSGTKRDRKGLDAMLEAAARREFETICFFSLSRLARESVIAMPLLKDLVQNHKVRVISVTEGIDSDREGWDMMASLLTIQHERYIKELSHNVFRGQEGAALAGHAVGDHCFGYKSTPIPGTENSRGRRSKPRMRYEVDDEKASWVRRIFHWFVIERQSLSWIARELNRLHAPKDHRSTKPGWHQQYVSRLLRNRKYIGEWSWGKHKNVRNPLTGQIRQELRSEEDSAKWTRFLPELQIVERDLFEKAQALLAKNREKHSGRRRSNGTLQWSKSGSADVPPRHLLQKLLACEACGAWFQVGGVKAGYLACPNRTRGSCSCRTQLRRDRAERMILDELGRRILSDSVWKASLLHSMDRAWAECERSVPSELVRCQQQLSEVDKRIAQLIDRMENGASGPAITKRLENRTAEQAQLQRRIDQLARANETLPSRPSADSIDEQLSQLGVTLKTTDPASAYALRDLVGGRIVVRQVEKAGCRHLQGQFSIEIGAMVRLLSDGSLDTTDVLRSDVTIDFIEPDSRVAASENVKALLDRDMLYSDIASQLEIGRSSVTRLVHFWFESRGLPVPDGRCRRVQLDRMYREPPQYQQISDEVLRLHEEELLFVDIADELNCTVETVRKSLAFARKSRGLDAEDGRTRRKRLERKSRRPSEGRRHTPDSGGNSA